MPSTSKYFYFDGAVENVLVENWMNEMLFLQ